MHDLSPILDPEEYPVIPNPTFDLWLNPVDWRPILELLVFVNICFFFYFASIATINACLVYFASCSWDSKSSSSDLQSSGVLE